MFFFFKQKTAYEMRISDWSSDVCSSDLLGVLSSRIHALFSSRLGGRHGVGNTPVYNTKCATAFAFPTDPPDKRKPQIREEAEALAALRKRLLAVHADLTPTTLSNVLEAFREGRALTRQESKLSYSGHAPLLRNQPDAT